MNADSKQVKEKVDRAGSWRSTTWRTHEIIRMLQARPYLNCRQLAEALEVSSKSVQRDIRFLQTQYHLPLEYDAQRHGYYFTGPVSQFTPLQLSRGELVALFIAQKAMEPLRGTRLQKVVAEGVQKIARACPEAVSVRWGELDEAFSVRSSGVLAADASVFDRLLNAVMLGREVQFKYRKLEGDGVELRRVQPLKVANLQHGWYLIGHDLERGEKRTFALQRMQDPEMLEARFDRDDEFDVKDYLAGGFGVWSYEEDGGPLQDICILLEGYAARYVAERRWHPSQTITLLEEDGSRVEFRVRLAGLEEITRWVLGWGSKAVVLEPAELRQKVAAELQHLAARYAASPLG